MEFKITVDISQVAEKLNSTRELLETKLTEGVKAISAATHAFIVNKANELDSFKRDAFLGIGKFGGDAQRQSSKNPLVSQDAKYVRWIEVSKGLWVVEIDPKAAWIEEGRAPTSMATDKWLLKPGSKGLKKAKDGSFYKSIPFTHQATGQKGASLNKVTSGSPGLKGMLDAFIKTGVENRTLPRQLLKTGSAGIIKKNGQPVIGLVAKLDIPEPDRRVSGFHSAPRSADDAARSGLRPHQGIFFLQGAAVFQRKNEKGKISRETVVFRTVSSKHQAEGRWMYPEVKPLGSMQAAHEYAQKAVSDMIKSIEEELRR